MIAIGKDRTLKYHLTDTTGFFDQATGVFLLGDAMYIGSYSETSLLCVTRPGVTVTSDPCEPWADEPSRDAGVQDAGSGDAGLQ